MQLQAAPGRNSAPIATDMELCSSQNIRINMKAGKLVHKWSMRYLVKGLT